MTGHDVGPKEGAGHLPRGPPPIHTEPCSKGQKTDTGILGLGTAISVVCPMTAPCLHAVTQRPALEAQEFYEGLHLREPPRNTTVRSPCQGNMHALFLAF